MAGLFGGGKSSGEVKHNQELGPPVDTSGSSIPGDDKIMRQMKAQTIQDNSAKRASTTLLGRSANDAKAGSSTKQVQNYA